MPLFSRIARSIQGRVAKLGEDNPDGALAKYVWLWRSMGKRPGQRLIPRPIRFFFVVSLDLFSLVAWYVRTRIVRVVRGTRSIEVIMNFARTNQVAALAIVAGGVIGFSLSSNFLLLSRFDDAPVPDPVITSYESAETLRLEEAKANSREIYTFEQIEAFRRLAETQRLLERDRMESIAEAVEWAREEIQRLLDRMEDAAQSARDRLEDAATPGTRS